jgi:hypothetical protein
VVPGLTNLAAVLARGSSIGLYITCGYIDTIDDATFTPV